ncbi:MAG: hypothetical protein IJ242_15380 [Clostridia bacterium]|nr:hypothetical protein [Clostridia bacterium]
MILSNRQKFSICFLLSMMLLIASGFAYAENFDRPLLFLNLPEDAQMIENVQFDDGDFIQTYQLNGSAHITLLRYTDFNMSIQDLMASEWEGAAAIASLGIPQISGQQTEGVRFKYADSDSNSLLITIVTVKAGQDTLIFEAVYPVQNGEDQVNAIVDQIIDSMSVVTMSNSDLG